jgi:hypothetical protein
MQTDTVCGYVINNNQAFHFNKGFTAMLQIIIFPSPRVIPSELFFEALSHNNPVFNSLASSVVEFER